MGGAKGAQGGKANGGAQENGKASKGKGDKGGKGGKQADGSKGKGAKAGKDGKGGSGRQGRPEKKDPERKDTEPILLQADEPHDPANPRYTRSHMLAVFSIGEHESAMDSPKEKKAEKEAQSPSEAATPKKAVRRLGSNVTLNAGAQAFVPGQGPMTPSGSKRISLAAAMDREAEEQTSSPSPTSPHTGSYRFGMPQGSDASPMGMGGTPVSGTPMSGTPMSGMMGSSMSPEMLHYLYSMSMPPVLAAAQAMTAAAANTAGYTTVMLRNIPNRYTRDMLVERLNNGYKNQYDFVYLPIDFNSKCNVGYGFINFRFPMAAQRCFQEFHGAKARVCLPGFSSKKICEVSYAAVQGREANMENFWDEKFIEKLKEHPEWHPLFFDDRNREIPLSKVLSNSRKRGANAGGHPPQAPPNTPYGAMMSPTGLSPFGMMGAMASPFGIMPTSFPAPAAAPVAVSLSGVLPNATPSTMLMLKHVPLSVSRAQLIKVFNEKYKGAFDFLYLPPVDLQNASGGSSRGYVFINFRTIKRAEQFTKDFAGKKMSACFSTATLAGEEDKVCEVLEGRLASLEKSIERLQAPPKDKGAPATEKAAWYPLLFGKDGEPLPFPLLTAAAGGGKASGTPSNKHR